MTLSWLVKTFMKNDSPRDSARDTVRFVRGTKTIAAIKAIRALSGMGLKDAKTAVENAEVFAVGADASLAETMVERLARVDAELELIPEYSYVYAFDPRSKARGDQVLERVGSWGTQLTHERGQLGDEQWERIDSQQFSTRAHLHAKIEALSASWRRAQIRSSSLHGICSPTILISFGPYKNRPRLIPNAPINITHKGMPTLASTEPDWIV